MPVSHRVYLTRRSNGYYYVGCLHEGKRRWMSTRARTKHDALQAVREVEDLLRQRLAEKTFSTFTGEYLHYARGTLRPNTVTIYERALNQFQGLQGDLPLRLLTAQHLDTYKAACARIVSPVSVTIELRALKSAFSVAVSWAPLSANPFQRVKKLSVPEAQPVYFTRQGFQVLLDTERESWLRELMVFAVSTGLRQGEMLNLRWVDVDLEHRLIHVHSTATFKTKAGKRRTVPMSDTAHALLSEKGARRTGELVFGRNGRSITASYLQHSFKRLVRDAKLDERLHWHSLRHTHATWLVQAGVSIYQVSKILGHSSVVVTQMHYASLEAGELHDGVNKIGGFST